MPKVLFYFIFALCRYFLDGRTIYACCSERDTGRSTLGATVGAREATKQNKNKRYDKLGITAHFATLGLGSDGMGVDGGDLQVIDVQVMENCPIVKYSTVHTYQ